MPNPNNAERFAQALAEISPAKRESANATRLRFERRQARIVRRQLELQNKRQQSNLDPIAKALAKAKALAGNHSA
jgi:hypothetical protein